MKEQNMSRVNFYQGDVDIALSLSHIEREGSQSERKGEKICLKLGKFPVKNPKWKTT